MNSNRKLARWGALALLVALVSGCCVAPWGGRYYGGERYEGGYEHGGYGRGGHDHGGYERGGDGWRR